MKRDLIDFFVVEHHQLAIHERLDNWSRWVEHRCRVGGKVAPMWANYRSNARQWHEPELRAPTNELDGQAMEKAVAMLPAPHRDAIRWNYVWKGGPLHMARKLGVSKDGLQMLVRDGRQMLINRRV
jgi:DNA-directed RNA polymerase specialized sigma24 family protein